MESEQKYPLSYREYTALRQLFGIAHIWNDKGHELEKRLKKIPNGWRDAKMLMATSEKLLIKVLETIPPEKIHQIKLELQNTWLEVVVRNCIGNTPKGQAYTYVDTATLERITDKAMELSCVFCEKKGKEARDCPLRKDIERTYHWDFPQIGKDGECHFVDRIVEDFKNAEI